MGIFTLEKHFLIIIQMYKLLYDVKRKHNDSELAIDCPLTGQSPKKTSKGSY